MSTLSWRHHTLIQAILSRGPLREDEFCSIFSDVTGKHSGTHQKLFNEYLLKINTELAFVQFELRACRNQYDGHIYYGVVNNMLDDQSKLGIKYTVPQIVFYKGIIEAIAQDATAQGTVSSIDALNIRLESQNMNGTASQPQDVSTTDHSALGNFSLSQKEKTLIDLVKDYWLCSTADNKIGLGIRSFLDLRSWFRNNEVPACEVCNEAGIKAELCPNESCNIRMHEYCLKQKLAQRRVWRLCPGCGTEWNCLMPKGEGAREGEGEDLGGRSHSQQLHHGPSTRKRLRPSEAGKTSSSQPTSNYVSRRSTRNDAKLGAAS